MTTPVGAVRAPGPERVAEAALDDVPGVLAAPVDARLLAGGHSWFTYELTDRDGTRVAARVAPAGGTLDPYDPAAEARAMGAAHGIVPVPDVLACVPVPNRLGAPYGLHAWADGRVMHLRDVQSETDRVLYRTALAEALGRIHREADPGVLGTVPGSVTEALTAELDRTTATFARSAPCRHPGITVGLRWLRQHLPRCDEPPVLCHGDFRFHNLAWSAPGQLAAVLDWERAWAGDPMADVAFTRRFSGWCAVDGEVVTRYEASSGRAVDARRVRYGDRLEHVRSYTSSLRGLRALVDARTDRLSLYPIGEAGIAGAWALIELLAEGPLDPLGDDGLDASWRPAVPVERQHELATQARAADASELADHLMAFREADAVARDRSLAALRAAATPGLARVLDHGDPEVAWAGAYAILADAVVQGGPSLLPPLRALALRDTGRPTLRRTTTLAGDKP